MFTFCVCRSASLSFPLFTPFSPLAFLSLLIHSNWNLLSSHTHTHTVLYRCSLESSSGVKVTDLNQTGLMIRDNNETVFCGLCSFPCHGILQACMSLGLWSAGWQRHKLMTLELLHFPPFLLNDSRVGSVKMSLLLLFSIRSVWYLCLFVFVKQHIHMSLFYEYVKDKQMDNP